MSVNYESKQWLILSTVIICPHVCSVGYNVEQVEQSSWLQSQKAKSLLKGNEGGSILCLKQFGKNVGVLFKNKVESDLTAQSL